MQFIPGLIGASLLMTFTMEMHEGRMTSGKGALDGSIVIGVAAIASRILGVI